ncbi:MAG: aldo/keto reductase [Desulfovibrio sp.]|nr:aldo/keto reductase [Desulfovibrio sp.]
MEDIRSSYALTDGLDIPVMGFGCYKAEGAELIDAVRLAVNIGYSLLDSAAYYHNEDVVGAAIKKCGAPRENLFVVSKIWPDAFECPVASLDKTLRDLKLDYLDAYLLHWPGLDEKKRLNAFEILLKEKEKGKIGVLGASNFLESHLTGIYDNFGFWPALNQFELHPYCQQKDLAGFCADRGIQIISSIPLGRGKEFDNPVLGEIAAKCGKSVPQIMLRWQIQKFYIPIPKSIHPARIEANADIFNFSLSEEDTRRIDALDLPNNKGRVSRDPLQFPE